MTRFMIGLLLGLLLGIGGTAAFLISAGGGDYLVGTSPRVRELEGALKNADQDRVWLRERLKESSEELAKLESRFSGLAARFETLVEQGRPRAGAPAALPSPAVPSPQPTPTAPATEDEPTPTGSEETT